MATLGGMVPEPYKDDGWVAVGTDAFLVSIEFQQSQPTGAGMHHFIRLGFTFTPEELDTLIELLRKARWVAVKAQGGHWNVNDPLLK